MTLDQAHQIATRLLALVGLLTLILTRELSGAFGFAALAAVTASFLLWMSGAGFILSRKAWATLNLVVLAFFLLDLFILSRSLLVASTHFVIFLMINKLFNLRTPQDHLQLYLISFLQLLAASTFTIDVTFLAGFVLYVTAATWALLLHHLMAEQARPTTPGLLSHPADPRPGLSWPLVFHAKGIAVFALGCTLLLFVALPRLGLGFFHRSQSDLIRMSGFSETVNLGEIGPIKSDPTVVMRIQPSRPLPAREGLYWRGMVFDYYDGQSWRNSLGGGALHRSDGSGVFNIGYRHYPERAIYQEIILEPLDTAILFATPYAIQVSGRFTELKVNAVNAVSLTAVPATRIDYAVTSQLPMLTSEDVAVRTITAPPVIHQLYLQLPEPSDRVRRLAEQITGSFETILQKVAAVEKYLEANYRYTLDVQPAASGSPIEDFLFQQKAGYCEHYASAMTLLLRSIGIPARLVTGFLPGEWNEFGKYYTVRQSNAHAWVEVWFPYSGWYPFDPTPPAPPESAHSMLSLFTQTLDSLQWRWNRYVIYYSLRDQIALAKGVREDSRQLQQWLTTRLTHLLGAAWDALMAALVTAVEAAVVHPATVALMILLTAVLSVWIWRRHRRRLRWPSVAKRLLGAFRSVGHRPGAGAAAFYFQMLRLLRSKGYEKPKTLTPREFLQQISVGSKQAGAESAPPRGRVLAPAAELTDLYYRVRFADVPLSLAEQARVNELLAQLKTVPTVP